MEGNPVFSYLDAFGTDLDKIQELKAHYQRGGLGDGTVKKYLLEVLLEFLEPIQKRRAQFEGDGGAVMEILRMGTEKANDTASPNPCRGQKCYRYRLLLKRGESGEPLAGSIPLGKRDH